MLVRRTGKNVEGRMKEKCPICEQTVNMISGLECPKCGHRLGMQNLETDWNQFDAELGRKKARNSDAQSKPDCTHNPKRRNPLSFE